MAREDDLRRIIQGGRAQGLSDDRIRALITRYDQRQQPAPEAPLSVERGGPLRGDAEQATQQFWEQPGAYAAETMRNIPRDAVDTGRGLAGTIGTVAGAAGEVGSYIGNTIRDTVGLTPYYQEQNPNLDALGAMPGLMLQHLGNYAPSRAALQLREHPVGTAADAYGAKAVATGAVRAATPIVKSPIGQTAIGYGMDYALGSPGYLGSARGLLELYRRFGGGGASAPTAGPAPPAAPVPRGPLPPVQHPPGWFNQGAPPPAPAAPRPTTMTWPQPGSPVPPPGPAAPPPGPAAPPPRPAPVPPPAPPPAPATPPPMPPRPPAPTTPPPMPPATPGAPTAAEIQHALIQEQLARTGPQVPPPPAPTVAPPVPPPAPAPLPAAASPVPRPPAAPMAEAQIVAAPMAPAPAAPPPPMPTATPGAPTAAEIQRAIAQQTAARGGTASGTTGPPNIPWNDPDFWKQNRVVSVKANRKGGTGGESFMDMGDQIRELLKNPTPENLAEAVRLETQRRKVEHITARPAKGRTP